MIFLRTLRKLRSKSRPLCSRSVFNREFSTRIEKILVANRGEIACRIISTSKKLGIPTVAVFSSADRECKHVRMADEASWIGEAPASESYLNHKSILEAAKRHGATAIHPGYGFLSEDRRFADQCTSQGLTFIGPPSEVLRAMGDKSEAKQIMRKYGVPVVPGYDGQNQETDFLIERGHEIGYPLLVKATMGGGGKGMKLARDKDDLKDSISSAQREAMASFGDARVLLERYIERPRHIEVQIMADCHGNVVHLFERDCSVQRRHQKIIEESPAPLISEDVRQSICSSAVDAAKAVGYVNAGTVEFIFDTLNNEHYFMEMNTRLQVEHPVTEGICGLDLVEMQILVAARGELGIKQEDIVQKGHCIEARVYTELPHQNFLPGAGKVERWKLPEATSEFEFKSVSRETRVDSGVDQGDEIGVNYDPMIAKVISKADTRNEAISELHRALTAIQVLNHPTDSQVKREKVDLWAAYQYRVFEESSGNPKFLDG